MESTDITAASNIVQILITALVTILGSWFLFRGKRTEAGASVEIARINNADDVMVAYGSLQAQLASAAENMIAPLNKQIEAQQRQLNLAHDEIKQLRDFVRQKSSEQELLTKRVNILEEENAVLRGKLQKAEEAEKRLRQKLNRIRSDIDTGELSSGAHKIDDTGE